MISTQRKQLLLRIPLLILPFLFLAFWALGGGQPKKDPSSSSGLNVAIPEAQLDKEKPSNKMSFYEQAREDSLQREEWTKNDPYLQDDSVLTEIHAITENIPDRFHLKSSNGGIHNRPEDALLEKIAQLERELQQPAIQRTKKNQRDLYREKESLEDFLQPSQEENATDADLDQIGNALDKILDIQHPERVKNRLHQRSDSSFLISTYSSKDTITRGFHLIATASASTKSNSIAAVVHQSQSVVSGSIIQFRLLQDIFIQDHRIPKGTYVSGTGTLAGERLMVTISSIRSESYLFPTKLDVYDLDGLAGISVPGAISRDVAKESVDQSLQLLEVPTGDVSLKTQAANTGIGAVKNLFSKKVKLVRVQLKAGYQVLFKDKNQPL